MVVPTLFYMEILDRNLDSISADLTGSWEISFSFRKLPQAVCLIFQRSNWNDVSLMRFH